MNETLRKNLEQKMQFYEFDFDNSEPLVGGSTEVSNITK